MKITSIIMSIFMALFSVLVPASASPQAKEYSETQQQIDEFFDTFLQDRSGALDDETYEIFMSIIKNVLAEAINNEGDSEEVEKLLNQIPVYESTERMDAERADITVNAFKEAFGEVLAQSVEDLSLPGIAKHFLTMTARGIYDMYIYFVPVEGQENVYAFYADYVNNKGEVVVVYSGAIYDKNTGKVYGINDDGMLGIGFDYNVKNFVVTTPVHSWQRSFGYTIFYDIIGEMGFMNCDTVRIKFEHGGKHWMFQLWKGNYAFELSNGAEIGIYNKQNKNDLMYDCATDEEMLEMSVALSHGDNVLVDIEEKRHWWICGFDFGNPIPRDELLLEGTIKFEDAEMMEKFMEAAKEYSDEMTVTAEDSKVTIIWQ